MPETFAPEPPELIPAHELSAFRAEWDAVQSMFVDDPPAAVAKADELAIRVLAALSDALTRERANIRQRGSQWDGTNTEELRRCLQQYRELFRMLLPEAVTPRAPADLRA
jgi:hypothetical protein